MKLNNKGFTLVEVLAVVVILGVLAVIMIPTVSNIINKNKDDDLNNIKNSILSAAKLFVSDNRYEIVLYGTCDSNDKRNVNKISGEELSDSKITVGMLFNNKYLSSSDILNPKNDNQRLNIDASYVSVKFDCKNKDYVFSDVSLSWE